MPNNPKLVGVTGGIGAGKSTVCKLFKILGVNVYDADARAKSIMVNDTGIIKSIKSAFGEEAYKDSHINRSYLAQKVFAHTEELKKLDLIVHPAIGRDFKNWVADQSGKYIIKEAALLIESGSYKEMDILINVFAPESTRVERLKNRDPFRSETEIGKIISRQISESQRQKRAHKTIINDGSELLIPQVLALHQQFSK